MNFLIKYLKIISILVLLPFFCSAQNNKKYYVEFNAIDTPSVASGGYGNYKLTSQNTVLNAIYARHIIVDFKKAFPTAVTPSLKRTYILQSDSSLFVELRVNNPTRVMEEVTTAETLNIINNISPYLLPPTPLPNDYGLAFPQTNLDLINVREAWQYTLGNPNLRIGITDTEFAESSPELAGKLNIFGVNSPTIVNGVIKYHGTGVASIMAGNTNNSIGLASVGYNCAIQSSTVWANIDELLLLSQKGIKVINCSWAIGGYSAILQNSINEIYDNGTILVIAAGNDNNSDLVYPAAYNNVISVASVGASNATNGVDTTYTDSHEFYCAFKPNNPQNTCFNKLRSQSHNKQVDIMAPGYLVPRFTALGPGLSFGSSLAAPHVAGTIGLMFSVNSSLKPIEVESILKLTSANIEHLPRNIQYAGMLGAGRLDAGKAVKMAFNMINQDTILIANKDIYRWPLKIGGQGSTAPFAIRMDNEILRDSVKADFTARKCIIITNSTLKPSLSGNINLNVNAYSVNYTNNILPTYANAKPAYNILDKTYLKNTEGTQQPKLSIYPIPANDRITIATGLNQVSKIKIFNLNGVLVKALQTNVSGVANADVSNLPVGVYIIQIQQNENQIIKKILVSR